jgi:hypothetical protein
VFLAEDAGQSDGRREMVLKLLTEPSHTGIIQVSEVFVPCNSH